MNALEVIAASQKWLINMQLTGCFRSTNMLPSFGEMLPSFGETLDLNNNLLLP